MAESRESRVESNGCRVRSARERTGAELMHFAREVWSHRAGRTPPGGPLARRSM
jgi:hypothetical protein